MERQYSCGFSHGNYGFIVGGKASTYFNDVWMYDALANNWIAKTSLPSDGRMGMCSFVINDTAYIIGGRTSSNLAIDEVWAYSILNDTWVQKNNLPFGERWRAAAVAQNNKGYLLFGLDLNDHFSNELFEYDPLSDSWTLLSTFTGKGRIYTSMFSFSNDLIFMAGLDSLGNNYSDMWRINVDTLNWQQLSSIPSTGRRGGICFNSASAIYHTTGIDQNNTRLKETWKVSNPTSIIEKDRAEKINCYPNPANQFIHVTIDELNNPSVITEIIDITGRIIQKEMTNNNFIRVNSIDLANGLYNIRIRTKDKIYYSKVIVQH